MATRKPRSRKSSGAKAARRAPATSSIRRTAASAKTAQEQLLQGVQQVWLAGMGAIARAQKDGPAAFQDAVLEGVKLLGERRSTAQRKVRDVFEAAQETLQTRVGGAREQAQETWDNLEALFQSRVQRAMHQLGVPTGEEVRILTRRVSELNENVRAINARGRARKPGKRKAAARRGAKGKRGRTAR
jgi:poly(hydroxyalkanoate) granule-associated protein